MNEGKAAQATVSGPSSVALSSLSAVVASEGDVGGDIESWVALAGQNVLEQSKKRSHCALARRTFWAPISAGECDTKSGERARAMPASMGGLLVSAMPSLARAL